MLKWKSVPCSLRCDTCAAAVREPGISLRCLRPEPLSPEGKDLALHFCCSVPPISVLSKGHFSHATCDSLALPRKHHSASQQCPE